MVSRPATHSSSGSSRRPANPIAPSAIPHRFVAVLLSLLLLIKLAGSTFAQQSSNPNAAPTEKNPPQASVPPQDLSPASTASLLRILSLSSRPDWTVFYRDPVPTTFPSRAQNALTLGSLYTDGLLACLAEDPQQIHNLARDLIAVAKPLGLTSNPSAKDPSAHPTSQRFDRSKSLTDCADQKKWEDLRLELEASQAAAEETLRKLEDPHLADLLSLGSWLRAHQVLATALVERMDATVEEALHQSIQSRLTPRLSSLLPKTRPTDPEKKNPEETTWDRLRTQTAELEILLSAARDTSQVEPCKWLKVLSTLLSAAPRRKTTSPLPCALE